MIKNNLKVVKSDSKKEQELKEKNKALETSKVAQQILAASSRVN